MTGEARQSFPTTREGPPGSPDDFEALYLQLLAAERAREEQFAMLAHELRNPLNALQASVEVLTRAMPGSREALSARDVIGRQVAKLAQLIDARLPPLGARAAAADVPSTRTLRIGVIEDDPDALFGLCALLALDGHVLTTAESGPNGLEMIRREAPDVAIVDIGLPGFDGCELARRSREEGYAGRLIALSGYGKPDDLQRSLAAGFEAHLVKPVDPETLTRLLLP